MGHIFDGRIPCHADLEPRGAFVLAWDDSVPCPVSDVDAFDRGGARKKPKEEHDAELWDLFAKITGRDFVVRFARFGKFKQKFTVCVP